MTKKMKIEKQIKLKENEIEGKNGAKFRTTKGNQGHQN